MEKSMWFTAIKGCQSHGQRLANEVPTNNEPISPGPCVNAMAFNAFCRYLLCARLGEPQGQYFVDAPLRPVQRTTLRTPRVFLIGCNMDSTTPL